MIFSFSGSSDDDPFGLVSNETFGPYSSGRLLSRSQRLFFPTSTAPYVLRSPLMAKMFLLAFRIE